MQRGHDYTNVEEPKKKKKWGLIKGAIGLGKSKKPNYLEEDPLQTSGYDVRTQSFSGLENMEGDPNSNYPTNELDFN